MGQLELTRNREGYATLVVAPYAGVVTGLRFERDPYHEGRPSLMRRHRAGRIVNISSVMGLIPAPYLALYASSKHAVEGYSESLDHEIRDSGVRVVLVEPAYTRTSFDSNGLRPDEQRALQAQDAAAADQGVSVVPAPMGAEG